MTDNKPTWVYYFWKYADEPFSLVKKTGVTGTLAYNSDADLVTAGIQNNFKIEGLRYRPSSPSVDVFAVGINAAGQGKSPGFWNSGDVLTVTEAGGIDGVETEFDVLGDDFAAMLAVGSHLETSSGEIMRVETITPGSPNYTITVERGAHATTAAAVLFEAELEILTPNCGMERITLTGDVDALDAPIFDTATGIPEAIYLEWHNGYTDDEKKKLKSYRIYYDTSADVDIESVDTDYIDLDKEKLSHVFYPKVGGKVDTTNTYYFVMTSFTVANVESSGSNEVSAKVWSSVQPTTEGPVTPDSECYLSGRWRIRANAKFPSSNDADDDLSYQTITTAKQAVIEIYRAPAGYGNPTTGTPDGNQTRILENFDKSSPYEVDMAVSSYGFGDYWARAKFIDGSGTYSLNWGISTVFQLTVTSNTTDTGIPTGVFLNVITDSLDQVSRKAYVTVGVGATGNFDSAKTCSIAFRRGGVGEFDEKADNPFVGAIEPLSTPRNLSGAATTWNGLDLALDYVWEVTARMYNSYGWSDWIEPEAIIFDAGSTSRDTDVCDPLKFGAWTRDNPPPAGWSADLPEPGPGQVVFDVGLPTDDGNTIWKMVVEGITTASFPTETVLKNQTNGTAKALPGYEVIITGFAATLNQYQGKYIRIGQDPGKNGDTDGDTLQVRVISSSTASVDDVFSITIAGDALINRDNRYGTVEHWEIIDLPIWKLVPYYEEFDPPAKNFGALTPKTAIFQANTSMKFRLRLHNRFGFGLYRESNTTADGSLTPGTATYKIISQVVESDIEDGAITTNKIGPGAVTPAKTSIQAQVTYTTVQFTPTSKNSFTYTSGVVYFQDGSSANISSGSKSSLSTNTTHWGYFTPGSTTLNLNTSWSSANDGTNVVFCIVKTTNVDDNYCSVYTIGGESVIGADQIICAELSAIVANLGTVNAGTINGLTIQTSSTASTAGGVVLNGTDFTAYDTDGDELLKIDKTNGLTVYSTNGDPYKVVRADHLTFRVYDNSGTDTGVQIAPTTDTAIIYTYWNGSIIGSISGVSSTTYNIATNSGVNLQISTNNLSLTTAGNLTLKGTYISLIDGGATSYLKMRRASDGATRYLSIASDDSIVVGSSPP